MSAKSYKVFIADDHPLFRQGLRQVIEGSPRFKVVQEADSGEKTLEMLEKISVDMLVLDIRMPGIDGFEVVRRLQIRGNKTDVIFLTMLDDEELFNEAMNLGAKGYLLKESAGMEILKGLETIARGRHFVSPAVSEFLFTRNRKSARFAERKPGLKSLSPAESRIVKLISQNKTSKEIAAEIHLSVRTVENHRANICEKLELRGAHSLVKFAFENKSRL